MGPPRPFKKSKYVPKFPCKICNYACKWNKTVKEKCLQCDLCNGWYHIDCLEMPSSLYEVHNNNKSLSWSCSEGCGMPQFWRFDSSLFDFDLHPAPSPVPASPTESSSPSEHTTPPQPSNVHTQSDMDTPVRRTDQPASSTPISNHTPNAQVEGDFKIVVANCEGVTEKKNNY